MKPSRCMTAVLPVMFLVAAFAWPAHALMGLPPAAKADLRVLGCNRGALVFAFSVSGNATQTLCALDPRTGRELWRQGSSTHIWSALTTDDALYYEAGGTLYKRAITNGAVLWQTPLNALPVQEPALPFSFTRLGQATAARLLPSSLLPSSLRTRPTRTASQFHYTTPTFSGNSLLLARTGTAGSDCVVFHCFDDWLLLDPATGRLVKGGAGAPSGQIGAATLFEVNQGTGKVQIAVTEGKVVRPPACGATDGTRFDPADLTRSQSWLRHTDNRYRIFPFVGTNRDLVVLEDAPPRFTRLSTPAVTGKASGTWHFRPPHLLHLASRDSRYATADESSAPPLVELFDRAGHTSASFTPPAPKERTEWGLDWVGPSGGTSLCFNRWQAVSNGFGREPLADDLFVLQIPSLRLHRQIPIDPRPFVDGTRYAGREIHPAIEGTLVFVLTGSVTLPTMESAQLLYPLRIQAFDTSTGTLAWDKTEQVLVRRNATLRR